jgi:hypothetical protein
MTDIDARIDALSDALVAAGVGALRPPEDVAPLAQLEAAIAPLRLPAAVKRFWQCVDPRTVAALPPFHPVDPTVALTMWRHGRDEFADRQPAILLLVGAEGHGCLSVELDSPGVDGGGLFEWDVVVSDFVRRFTTFGEWISHMTTLIEQGAFERNELGGKPWLFLDDAPADPASPPPGVRYHVIPRDILGWPPHWQRASGLHPEDIEPRGATHSIGELLASDPHSPLEATIAGSVIALGGSTHSTQVRVNDGTGTIDIHCPAAVTLLGPSCPGEFEFDVHIDPGERVIPQDPDAVAAGVADPEERVTKILIARYGGPPGAIATAVRRIEPAQLH